MSLNTEAEMRKCYKMKMLQNDLPTDLVTLFYKVLIHFVNWVSACRCIPVFSIAA